MTEPSPRTLLLTVAAKANATRLARLRRQLAAAQAYIDEIEAEQAEIHRRLASTSEHQHEQWQIRDDGDGNRYCAACGERP